MVLYEEPGKLINRLSNDCEVSERHSLYLRFPKKLDSDRTLAEAEVKSLYSKITRVRFPRQRSANFCIIDFDNSSDKEKARIKLKQIQINEKHLVVKESVRSDKVKVNKRCEKIKIKREVNQALGNLVGEIKKSLAKDYGKRNVTNGLMVRDLKAGTTQADIRQSFPEAIDIKVTMKPEQKNSYALIWLPTPAAAKASEEMVQISGEEYMVTLQKENKSQKKFKNVKATNDNDSSSENMSASEDEGENGDDSADVDESD